MDLTTGRGPFPFAKSTAGLATILVVAACAAAPAPASPPTPSSTLTEAVVQPPPPDRDEPVAAEASPSTIAIAQRASRMAVFIKSGGSYGAGVLMDRAGLVLTCAHVTEDDADVFFESEDEPRRARLVGRDEGMDLALLRLEAPPPAQAEPALNHPLGSALDLERGQQLYAMGSPRKMTFSFHRGMVSYLGRSFDDVRFIQTDLPMNPGSSGGPVFDDRGRLVGIAAFIIRDGQGLSFALPIDYALKRFTALGGTDHHRDRIAAFDRWVRAAEPPGGGEADVTPASSPR